MATFQARIEDIIGDIPLLGGDSDDSQQAINDALTDATAEILDIVSEDYLWSASTNSGDKTSNPVGSTDTNTKILKVERKNNDDVHGAYISCKFISPLLISSIQNPESIHYPSSESPVWTWDLQKINVFPAPASNYEARVIYVTYPTVLYSHTSINDATVLTGVTATNADPTVFTKTAHQLVDGDIVELYGFSEMTEINGTIGTVNQLNSSTFEINGISADPAETTGGSVVKRGGFASELEHVVVLGACVKLKQRQVSFYNEDEDTELSQMHQSQYADIIQLYSNAVKPFLEVPAAEE
jgi:hypothetical protein